MRRLLPKHLSSKLILVIASIWVFFVAGGVWLEVTQARRLALDEVERWGRSAGEGVRVALNTLMREGKMSARFSYFEDLSSELSEVESIRVIRGPRVNEIFEQVRREIDVPREQAFIETAVADLAELRQALTRTDDPDERADIAAEMEMLDFEVSRARALLRELQEPLQTDPRSRPRDALEREVLQTAEVRFDIEGDLMRMVAPYQVRRAGCSEANGCHFNAREGEVLGAVEMVFSIAAVNRDIYHGVLSALVAKVMVSIIALALVYLSFDRLVIRQINGLRKVMSHLSSGNLDTRFPQRRQGFFAGDEVDELASGFNDMAARLQEDKRELERLANHDGLTGLLNRARLSTAFEQLLAERPADSPVSLMMMDVDHFKNINDSFGHQVGDDALRMISGVVRENARQGDLVARYGGEEILVVLPATPLELAVAMAERLRRAIAARPLDDRRGETLCLTVSIGVAELPRHAQDGDGLIRAADAALYRAKAAGRNRVAVASAPAADGEAAFGPVRQGAGATTDS